MPKGSDAKKQAAVDGKRVLEHMRAICLSFPDTHETLTWGQPHFRVANKIFCGCGDEKGKWTIGFKLEMEHADAMLADPRFVRAPYVGHKGWLSMDAAGIDDWQEVRTLVAESYRLIAPKKSLQKLSATGASAQPAAKKPAAKKPAAKKAASKAKPRTTRSAGRATTTNKAAKKVPRESTAKRSKAR